jgi:hypothetical protein
VPSAGVSLERRCVGPEALACIEMMSGAAWVRERLQAAGRRRVHQGGAGHARLAQHDGRSERRGPKRLVARRGARTHIRCDNGPEMTAHALIDWCSAQSTLTSYSTPVPRGRTRSWSLPLACPRRAAERRAVLLPRRSPGRHRGLARGLQSSPSALRPWPQGSRRLRCRLDAPRTRGLTPRRARVRGRKARRSARPRARLPASFRPRSHLACRALHPPDSHIRRSEERGPAIATAGPLDGVLADADRARRPVAPADARRKLFG